LTFWSKLDAARRHAEAGGRPYPWSPPAKNSAAHTLPTTASPASRQSS